MTPHRIPPARLEAEAARAADLETLFREQYQRVFRAAYRVTGDATDAEDVVQTVFLRVARREEPLHLPEGAAAYLHRAAVNAALDLLRARARSRRVDLAEAAELVDERAASPEAASHRAGLRRAVRRAVSRLSPRGAEVFALRYFEGYANREIAQMLGTSQTAVAVILHRSRHRLQKELRPLLGGAS